MKKLLSLTISACSACLLLLGTGLAKAADYTLPAAAGSGPFASCTFGSGSTYNCSSSVSLGNNDSLTFSSNITLRITGSFNAGNNAKIFGNGNTLISTSGNISIGNGTTAAVNLTAVGNVSVGNSAKVNGTVSATGSLALGNGTEVNGACNKPPTGGGTCVTPLAAMAEYRFDECSWTSGILGAVKDASGNSNHATAYMATTSTGGVVQRAADFAAFGASDYGVLPANLLNGQTDFTVSLWFKTSLNQARQEILHGLGSSNSDDEFEIALLGTTGVQVNVMDAGFDYTAASSFADGNWHHLGVTRFDSSRVCVYLDGVALGCNTQASGALSISNSNALVLGQKQSYFGGGFSSTVALRAQLDELKIIQGALSRGQLETVRSNELAGSGWQGTARAVPCCCVPTGSNVLANAGFEQLCSTAIVESFLGGRVNIRNNVCGWSMSGAGMETWERNAGNPAAEGNVFVEVDGYAKHVDSLWQDIKTVSGGCYNLSLKYKARDAASKVNRLIIRWNNTQVYDTSTEPTSWQTVTVNSLIATGADRLTFAEAANADDGYGTWIDDVRLTPCATVDHYVISYPLGRSGLTCEAMAVAVTAHTAADSISVPAAGTRITLSTSPSTGGWALKSGAGTFTAPNIYVFSGTESVVEFWLTQSSPLANIDIDVTDGSKTDKDGDAIEDPKAEFQDTAFKFYACTGAVPGTCTLSSINHLTSGQSSNQGDTAQNLYLRAVRSGSTCGGALSSVSSNIDFAYECNNPATCTGTNSLSLAANAVATPARNNNAGVSLSTGSYTAVPMTFDANGYAPFNLTYSDVGAITLYARATLPSGLGSPPSVAATLYGVSNSFTVKPHTFVVTDIKKTASPQTANPAAVSLAGGAFVQAGEPFSATVTALNASCAANASGYSLLTQIPSTCITPSFGREASARTVSVAHALLGGLGLTNASTLSNATAFGAFSGGSATGTTFSWGEVGIITLQPALVGSDYLGAGNVIGTPSAAVGRFYPARFDTSVVQGCSAGGFTYSGQTMALTVTAKNQAGTTLLNYHGTSFAQDVNVTDPNAIAGTLSVTTISRSNFGSGVAVMSPAFTFSSRNTAPSVVKLRATDATDGISSSTGTEATASIRSGRLRLLNAYGSELLALSMSLTAQYWNGLGYGINTQDSCTSLTVPTSVTGMVFGAGNLSAGETVASLRGTTSGNVTLLAGDAVMSLTKPGAGNSGFVDITVNTPNWLKYPWTSVTPGNASGRATFGIYKTPLIYRRENY